MAVVASSEEKEDTTLGAEDQSNPEAYTTFKIISAQPANTEARMQMW